MLNEYAPARASPLWHLTASPGCVWGASAPDLEAESLGGPTGLSAGPGARGSFTATQYPGARGGRDARSVWEAGGEGFHGCWSPSLTEALTSGRSPSEQPPGV